MQFYVCLETHIKKNNKNVKMGLIGFRGSEIPFKCKQCHFRFKWKYNFGTYKPNEQWIYSPIQILNAKSATLGLSRNTTFVHNNKKFEMRQIGFRGSEILFKCKQCHFRFKWKYNLCTHKPNEQSIYSPVQILNAKNAILCLSGNTTFGHNKKVWNGAKSLWTIQNTFQMNTVPF